MFVLKNCMFGSFEKKGITCSPFLNKQEGSKKVQEAKPPRKFGVLRSFRYESYRNRLFYKTVSGNFEIFILHRFPSLFGLSLTKSSTIAITF